MRPAALLPLLAAGALAGCQAAAPRDQAAGPALGTTVATTAATAATTPADTPVAHRDLLGLDQAALRRQFGDPALRRREGPALVLAYRFDDCVLHLFLYPGADDAPRVRHAAAIGTDRHARDAATCRP